MLPRPPCSSRFSRLKYQPGWVWVSIQPGITVRPLRSYVEAPRASATREILLPSITISLLRRTPPFPSRIVVVLITMGWAGETAATAPSSSEIAKAGFIEGSGRAEYTTDIDGPTRPLRCHANRRGAPYPVRIQDAIAAA